jgi:hypothetical protein
MATPSTVASRASRQTNSSANNGQSNQKGSPGIQSTKCRHWTNGQLIADAEHFELQELDRTRHNAKFAPIFLTVFKNRLKSLKTLERAKGIEPSTISLGS